MRTGTRRRQRTRMASLAMGAQPPRGAVYCSALWHCDHARDSEHMRTTQPGHPGIILRMVLIVCTLSSR